MSSWVGVASRAHVRLAVEGSFCQLNHGKEAPLKRLARGDTLYYYSPREEMRGGAVVQAFTAMGEIVDAAPWQARGADDFHPFRRKVRWRDAGEAPIRPLLEALAFTRGKASWGQALRRGVFEIDEADATTIAKAMRVGDIR